MCVCQCSIYMYTIFNMVVCVYLWFMYIITSACISVFMPEADLVLILEGSFMEI